MEKEYRLSNNEYLVHIKNGLYEIKYGTSVQISGSHDDDLNTIKLNECGKKFVKGETFDGYIINKLYIGTGGGLYIQLIESTVQKNDDGYRKKNKSNYIIAIDFDGTIVTHEYPYVGKPLPYANDVIKMLIENGHKCFLYTMRDGSELLDAIEYCQENGLDMCGWNESPEQFSESPKQYAQFYVDDAAVGCPLSFDSKFSKRPYVNWVAVARYFEMVGLLTHDQIKELNIDFEYE